MSEQRHYGIHSRRLAPDADNPREVAFAEKWRYEQHRTSGGELVDWILKDWNKDKSQYSVYPVSNRDAAVAATIIQWLGTNCGIAFLCDCINSSPEALRYVEAECFNRGMSDHARLLQQAREEATKAERERCRRDEVQPLIVAVMDLRDNGRDGWPFVRSGNALTEVTAKQKENPL